MRTFINKGITMVIMFMVAVCAYAVPAKRVWKTVTLADGTEVKVMTVGDEHGHWMVDNQGKALAMNADGKAYYLSGNRFAELKNHRSERINKANARRVARMERAREKAQAAFNSTTSGKRKTFGVPTAISGKKKGIVILVNFSDKSFNSKNTQAVFDNQFNKVGYSDNGCIGSVHDYFYDQSYGKFDLSFDVVGPVTVSKTHNYYGANDSDGNDKYAATMVIEAIKLADQKGVNFADYDWDGDGEVDQVFVIYAGTGEAASDVTTDIWPHEYELSSAKENGDGTGPLTLDGVKIDTYACSSELATSTTIDGIGTACHEFSHCLGYADLYDTDYSGGQGMMYWDLLDAGSYNGPNDHGEVPAAYTSFERWWAGWLDPVVLSSAQYVTDMPALNDTAVAYKIVNDAHPDEYYLLENRQAKGWDSYTACNNDGTGHGMMILHVDYDKSTWQENAPNDNPNRQRMTYFPADNNYGTKQSSDGQYYWSATYAQIAGDPFPGTKKNTSFTDDSSPAATLYNNNTNGTKKMGKPITDIVESDGKISFTFMGGIAGPETQEPSDVTSNSFTATWTAVDGADSYELEVTEVIKSNGSKTPVLSETCSNCKTSSTTNISSKLDSYTDVKGWKGTMVYQDYKKFKIGSTDSQGYMTTPAIEAPLSGDVTIKGNFSLYNKDTNPITIYLKDNDGNIKSSKELKITSTAEDYIINFSNVTYKYKITIIASKASKNRFYISGIDIYDGNFTADDLTSSSAKAISKVEAKSYTGLTGTSYLVKDLTEGGTYKYRVRAVIGENTSSWSAYKTVSLTQTGIANVYVTPNTTSDAYFNLQGQRINKSDLTPGIYIHNGRKEIIR